jgi:hypothetical protein
VFRTLTPFQQSIIKGYMKLAKVVYFHGIDENVLPVISYTDDAGDREPFAIRPRPVRAVSYSSKEQMLIPKERTITEVAYPLRWITEEELDFIDPDSHELLSKLVRVI